MPPFRTLLLVASTAIVSGCLTAEPPEPSVRTEFIRAEISAEARKPCAAPVKLPDRSLTAREVTTSWGQDRSALRVCESRRRAAVGDAPQGAAP